VIANQTKYIRRSQSNSEKSGNSARKSAIDQKGSGKTVPKEKCWRYEHWEWDEGLDVKLAILLGNDCWEILTLLDVDAFKELREQLDDCLVTPGTLNWARVRN
jgi:hypothetical protein